VCNEEQEKITTKYPEVKRKKTVNQYQNKHGVAATTYGNQNENIHI